MTSYIVLAKQGDGNRWTIIGSSEAYGPTQAAKRLSDNATGEYLAIPVRNATFVELDTEQPPPRTTVTEHDASRYLGEQLDLPDPVNEPVEPDPVAA
jgi:hypothetical protein